MRPLLVLPLGALNQCPAELSPGRSWLSEGTGLAASCWLLLGMPWHALWAAAAFV